MTLAYYEIYPTDCRGFDARRVTLEVQITDEAGHVRPCTECARTLYVDDSNLLSATAVDTSHGRIAFIGFVPIHPSLLVMRDAETGRALGAVPLIAVAGSMHTLGVSPASRSDARDFPEALR
jgi:hypothetical protein